MKSYEVFSQVAPGSGGNLFTNFVFIRVLKAKTEANALRIAKQKGIIAAAVKEKT